MNNVKILAKSTPLGYIHIIFARPDKNTKDRN